MPGTKHRPDIDGLRAVAVILVLGFHAFPNALPGGFIGVDVFFVISGYLITGIIADGIASDRFSFLQFYARRARRLFPALTAVLACALAAGWLLLTPGQLEALGEQTAATTLFIPNFLFWSQSGYFDAAASTKPLLHMWSLGVEEQFYLVWPALLLVIARLELRLRLVLAVITALSFGHSEYLTHVDPVAAFYSPFSRAWELSIGGLIATRRKDGPALPVVSNLAVSCGLAAILFCAWRMKAGIAFPGLSALPVVLATALIVFFGDRSGWARLSLGSAPFEKLGQVSYPLYLWHWPILTFAHLVADAPLSPFASSIALLASLVLAFFTYYAIELPLRDAASLQRIAMASTATLVVIGLGGLVIDVKRGLPERLPVQIQEALDHERYDFKAAALWETCWLRNDVPPDAMLSSCLKVGRDDALVVWGDSHAAMLATGLRANLGAERISQLTKSSCPPILKDDLFDSCRTQNDAILEAIKRTRPKTVILFSYWQLYATEWSAGSVRAGRLARTIQVIKDTGVSSVVLIGPPPIFKPSLPSRLFHRWLRSGAVDERLKPENVEATTEIDRDMASIARNSGAEYASLLHLLCNDQGCLTRIPELEKRFGGVGLWPHDHRRRCFRFQKHHSSDPRSARHHAYSHTMT